MDVSVGILIQVHFVVLQTAESLGCKGNLLLDRLMGATFILHPYPVLGPDKEWSSIIKEITERYCNQIR